MDARQTIESLLKTKEQEPYGNLPIYQVGYLVEVLVWLCNFHPEIKDDLKALLDSAESKQKGN